MQTADFNGSGRYRATENNYERMHQTSKRIEKCIWILHAGTDWRSQISYTEAVRQNWKLWGHGL